MSRIYKHTVQTERAHPASHLRVRIVGLRCGFYSIFIISRITKMVRGCVASVHLQKLFHRGMVLRNVLRNVLGDQTLLHWPAMPGMPGTPPPCCCCACCACCPRISCTLACDVMYLCTHRSTQVASPTVRSGSLYIATHFRKHCSVILRPHMPASDKTKV